MNIIVNEELRAYIDPLTPDEHQALERSILAEGCRDALVLWGDLLIDGHNRHGICTKHGIPFQTVQNTRFKSIEDVHLWMIDQHLGRRSVSDFQRGVLALRKKEIVAARARAMLETPPVEPATPEAAAELAALPPPERLNTREAVAKAARISSTTVQQIEKIQKSAAPELVEAVKQGAISINAAAVVASLPAEEQAAAVAGGKKELREAAKRVRGARVKPKVEIAVDQPDDGVPAADASTAAESLEQQIARLTARVAELEAENAALRAQIGR